MNSRYAVAAALLGAACVTWSAVPLPGVFAGWVLAAAAACTALGAARLWLGAPSEPAGWPSTGERLLRALARLARGLPWAELTVVAVLVLEALHHSRPWHTAVLGAALLAYLLAVHLAESGARPAVLRPQVPLLTAGLGLLVLAAGAAVLPAVRGSAAGLMAIAAGAAAIAVAATALRA